jgi:hypothetical protein
MEYYELWRCVKGLEAAAHLLAEQSNRLMNAEANTDKGRATIRLETAKTIREVADKLQRISEHIEATTAAPSP